MKDPAFLFYSSDFLSGISDLTMEERGQYITMLCLQHQKGNLNDKTIRLNVGSVSVDVIAKFQKDKDGNFFNKRLEDEIQKRNLFTESRRTNGSKGGRPKKQTKPKGKPKNNHMDNHMGDVNENENKDKKEDETEILKTPLEKKFDEFLEYRKQIKKPVVEKSLQPLKNKLWELSNKNTQTAIDILDQTITNGWQGIFEIKNNNNNGKPKGNNDEFIKAIYDEYNASKSK